MIEAYELANDGRLVPVSTGAPTATSVTDGTHRWVRLAGALQDEWQAWLSVFDLPHELLDQLRSDGSRAQVIVRGPVLLVTLPMFARAEGHVLSLQLASSPSLLATWEPERLPAIDHLAAEFCGHHRPVEANPSGVMLEVVEAAVRHTGPEYLAMRRSMDELDDALEDHPLEVPSEALLDLKRRLGRFMMLWEEQGHCFLELQRRRSHVPQSEAGREQLRVIVSDLDRGLKLLAQMEGRLRDLRQHHLHSLQEVANRRLNVLAVLSAIYLPATLIAGIYGMNFDRIPMTQTPYGYFVVIAGMAAVVVGQLWYFYRRGWFN